MQGQIKPIISKSSNVFQKSLKRKKNEMSNVYGMAKNTANTIVILSEEHKFLLSFIQQEDGFIEKILKDSLYKELENLENILKLRIKETVKCVYARLSEPIE